MSVHFVSPSKKSHFGIEVAKVLKWNQWEPGGEYTQLITLKNVNKRTKKLKYRIPNTNFFTTRYPQPIVLSSGMSINLPITFRPLRKDKYEDVIEFITKEGQFEVPMKATQPEASLNFPEMVKFGMCAVKDQLSIPFQITNTSDLQITFQLKAENPFTLSPTSGTLAPKTHCQIEAVFKPEAALVYELDAECLFGSTSNPEKISKIIKFEGIGKYIHLGVRCGTQSGHDVVLDFGEVSLGKKIEKTMEIKNFSPVDAPFQILQKTNVTLDNVFSCSKYHGIIAPESTMEVKIAFQPELKNTAYVDNFEVLAVGMASKSFVKCLGIAVGPEVSIETDLINFGTTKPYSEVSRSFKIHNKSNLDAVFQEPITLQLFGTCCTDQIKPGTYDWESLSYYSQLLPSNISTFKPGLPNAVVLSRQHLLNKEVYIQRGISRLSPEEIHDLMKEDKIRLDDDNLLTVVDKEVDEKLDKPERKLTAFEEYFHHCVEPVGLDNESSIVPSISVDVDTINFGKCKEDTIIQKTVNVNNNTFGKVTCVWINNDNKFQVSPNEVDIGPMSASSFRVVFRPDEASKYYSAEMEGFVFYKSMRDHRLVEESLCSPPWCITADVVGHTFPKQKETFLPVCTWDSPNMVFPSISSLTESVYRTCLLTNDGRNPIHYSFEKDPTEVFSCKPHMALVRDKYHVIACKMNAMEFGVNKRTITCMVNDMEKFSQQFVVKMTAEQPDVALSPKDILYFKPTCIGNMSKQTVSLTNRAGVPLRCQWKVAKVDGSIVKVEAQERIILSNEIQHHTWTFTPANKLKHLFKVKLLVSTLDSTPNIPPKKYVLRLIGEGQTGNLECEDSDTYFGEINVGDHATRSVVIYNNNSCSLDYKLCVDQFVTSIDDPDEIYNEGQVITLDHYEFLLPAKASKTVHITMAPKRRANYECNISYHLASGDMIQDNFDDPTIREHLFANRPLFTVRGKGVYPQVQINDVRGAGCAESYSKKFLWELLHLDNLNTLLQMEPSTVELKYQMASRHSTRRRMPVTTSASNEFNFSSAVYGSEPCCIYINIQNTGASPVDWVMKYPTDFQLEMEYWAETGDLADDELHEMYVMNSELFVVTPRSGRLKAGKSQTVSLIYNHTSLGTHQLPVLLKVSQGREIRLNFIGTTLEAHRHTLHFISSSHYFTPVSIGVKTPPVQSYTLHNGSGQTTRFAFDISVLDLVEKDNYDHRIFECLTPEGEVGPYQSVEILWLFSPIEARSYTVGVPLLIENNEIIVISFTGAGYDPNLMGNTVNFQDDELSFPVHQLVHAPDQLLKISSEFIQFGHVSLFCEVSQLIFLTNISSEHTLSFHWIIKGTQVENFLTITPSNGFLKPKEHIMCQVSVFSRGPSAVHDFGMRCEVIDETLMAQFKCELKAWTKRREEKKHLFTIRDVSENKMKANRPGSTTSKRLVSITNSKLDNELKKYETLPPIKGKIDKGGERRVIVEERPSTLDDLKPLPPKSYISHLGIHITTHSIDSFQRIATDKSASLFIQRNPSVDVICNPTKLRPASGSEMDILECLLKMLLKDSINDEDFKHTICEMENEAVPYYSMITPNLRPLHDVQTTHLSEEDDDGALSNNEKDFLGRYSSEDLTALEVMNERQCLKRNDEMRLLLNEILESTISNILHEANLGEVSLTNRPRLIATQERPPTSSG